MDLLSVALRRVRLRGDEVTAHGPGGTTAYDSGERVVHVAVHGPLAVTQDGVEDLRLSAGDAVLLPRGEPHRVRSLLPESAGDGAHGVAWLTGRYTLDEAHPSALVSALPNRIVLRDDGRSAWLAVSTQQLLTELHTPSPGSWLMVSRILDLLFVHALRHDARTSRRPGWLVTALDPHLGPVVDAVHRDPGHPWTLAELAQLARMSRSVLSERFARVLDTSPGAYVAGVRLDRAADQLRDGDLPVSAVARRSGYGSDAAFARAFRRRYGLSPSDWRAGSDLGT